MALKPYLMFTVNIAPSIERISGTLTTTTNAPIRTAKPPRISSNVTSQALARGNGTSACFRSSANAAGPRLHLAHPWTMNPTPMIIRTGTGTHRRHRSPFKLSIMSIPLSRRCCSARRTLQSTTAELLRVKRHKFPDAHRRPAGQPLHAVRQPVIPTCPVQLAHRHEMPGEVLRHPPLLDPAFPMLGGDVGVRDLTVVRVRELPGDPVHVLWPRTGEFVYQAQMRP